MNQVDRLYRAFIDYRKQTVGAHDCDRARDAIAKANEQEDTVTLERKICTVENDWIDAIEKGLVYIEKAIREERQFIRSNGEVLPIEKVKRVDKESVVHLARHSNLLTKVPEEGADIIPDELYTVERLSDYAVYENRFLYRLLCYLRDFITLRYDKIVELTTTYNGNLFLEKSVDYKKQKMKLKIQLSDQRKNDAYLREYNEAKDSIDRMDLILKAVIHYLHTPLMEEVAKAPMLKPPITKTNVLKMNQNFKACMALYEYITSYDRPGYTVEDFKKTLKPFSEIVADEFAEAVSLLSFLTYEHGLGIETHLRENYQEEEKRRKEEEGRKLREQIKKLKKRIEESGMAPEEYMLMLEKRNRSLENDSAQLVIARQEIERLTGEVETLTGTVATLETQVQSLQDEIVALKEQHEREIAQLHEHYAKELEDQKNRYETELENQKNYYEEQLENQKNYYEEQLENQKNEYETKLAEQQASHEAEVARMQELHEQTVTQLNERYTAQIEEMTKFHEAEKERFEKTIQATQSAYAQKEETLQADIAAKTAQWQEEIRQHVETSSQAQSAQAKAEEACVLLQGRLNALRFEHGLIKDKAEFTSKVAFEELEHQYEMFKKLFKQEWGKNKKDIRSRVVWSLFKRDAEAQGEVRTAEAGSAPEITPAQQMPMQSVDETAQTVNNQGGDVPTDLTPAQQMALETERQIAELMNTQTTTTSAEELTPAQQMALETERQIAELMNTQTTTASAEELTPAQQMALETERQIAELMNTQTAASAEELTPAQQMALETERQIAELMNAQTTTTSTAEANTETNTKENISTDEQ